MIPNTPIYSTMLTQLASLVTTVSPEREQIPVCAPFTGQQIGSVPICQAEDVREALKRARMAQQAWAATPFAERRTIFLRYHDLLLRRQNDLLDLLQIEAGKARHHTVEEVLDTAINARYYADLAESALSPHRRAGVLPFLSQVWEYHHPVGVVGLISPWNYPLTMALSDALPALMAGNAVILKPSEETPFTALMGLQLLREAGLPTNLFQIVTGYGPDLGPHLIGAVDFIGFTGSTAVGRLVAQQAGQQLIKCSLELGGKNPMLVLDDADLGRAVTGTVHNCFSNAGQLCVSIERVYVQRGIYEPFVTRLVEQTQALRLSKMIGYQKDSMGSLASADQLSKVSQHVDDALAKGATLLTGGRARPDIGPYFYEPTILTDVTPDMLVYQEETFGPVVVIYPFDHVEDAIEWANDSEYGLNATIWSRDTHRARSIARRIQCGTVNINDSYPATWGAIDSPMGGMKQSGLSRRHGREGLIKYTESQTVARQRLLPLTPLPGLKLSHYAMLMTILVYLMKYLARLR
ncbi:succinic semialdehyde dehydrogenase [Anaerolineales bacterium HSG6]|nr:succinic semialdehyde dehydrogenase [Anaerolineales bacterium HSG6]